MHQSTPFLLKILEEGPTDSSPGGDGYIIPTPYPTLRPHKAFLIRTCAPQNSGEIYVTDVTAD